MSEYIVEGRNIIIPRQGKTPHWTEIVRCGDCKHYDPNDEPSEVFPDRYWCDKLTVYMPPNGFCSFGERREP